ncbi:hypothetical protein D3C84_1204970 [compost metagenome]
MTCWVTLLNVLWMRVSILPSRVRSRVFSVCSVSLPFFNDSISLRIALTCPINVATVSRGVSPAMPRAFACSGLSVALSGS